ncbi:hypothetical protein K488DRAFT_78520 [Vararia minispora EC-137]|uniref:Uncharacterized protein n=1 Tax=Vararia minispora EC-137 TaxID=1314806 RepID=A0ACB8QL85_9AGAM|nr:hypothetical protein K488DRAFT_78520 [Vararia minispora EC-137]
MSDAGSSPSRSPSPAYAPPKKVAAPRKRKSDASAGGSGAPKKKARASKADDDGRAARELVATVIANPDAYTDGELGSKLVLLARYARSLEGAKAKKGEQELAAETERIRKAAHSGIKAQMKWRPSCKQGGARWVYDGFCPDPDVFGRLLGLDGPPTFKMKKFSAAEFGNHMGHIVASARYNEMRIKNDVNIRYNAETGEYKFSGSYGV